MKIKCEKNRILQVLKVILMISIVLMVSGCTKKDTMNGSENYAQISETNIEDTESTAENTIEQLNQYAIIRPEVQLILKNDGTVIARGKNEKGELGNGQRVDSNEWGVVSGLENVVGIFANKSFGLYENESDSHFYCYALTSDGSLYRWGGNILNPERVSGFSTITEIKQTSKDLLMIQCENNERYLMSFNTVISCDSLEANTEVFDALNDQYILLNNGKASVIKADWQGWIGGTEIEFSQKTLTETIESTKPIDVEEDIVGVSYNYLLGSSGKVYLVFHPLINSTF
ncbi:MAG: hypothetical protein PHW34_12620 [Hespellia sp.]|nr:hypothetical protein [Hespellia sp.]